MIGPSELRQFYSKVGECIWHLQHVENALATCLALKLDLKDSQSVNREDADRHLAKHLRNTLGTSIRIASEKQVLGKELMAALAELKEERDWLVHRSMNENGDDLYSSNARSNLLDRLESSRIRL